MSDYLISPKQIQSNWKTFRDIINEISPSRRDSMNRMYDELEERICLAPASSVEFFHNAVPGGYVDHVLRVYKNAMATFDLWKTSGMVVDNFTLEELSFAAMKHDLGKVGMPGTGMELYQKNQSDWHRKNQGKIYQMNPNMAYMENTARTFYLLNHYGIKYSENEMLGIQLTDGLYNEANKIYLVSYDLDKKLRTTMGLILHHADLMAARYEFEQWAMATEKFKFSPSGAKPVTVSKPQLAVSGSGAISKSQLDIFSKVFPDLT